MIKVALVGTNGLLGHIVANVLSKNPNFTIHAYNRNIALRRESNIKYLAIQDLGHNNINYDYLINCAGCIKQKVKDKSPKELEKMIEANVLLPVKLSLLKNVGIILHQSSDAVFGGDNSPKNEDSPHEPQCYYSKTKSLGEIESSNFYSFRCSLVGKELNSSYSLLSWFLNQKEEVIGYNNIYWNGIAVTELAKIYERIVVNNLLPKINNHNIVPAGPVTKHYLLQLFNIFYKKDIIVRSRFNESPSSRILTTLDKEYNTSIFGGKVKTIEEMIREMAAYKL